MTHRVTAIRDDAELVALAPEWADLWERCPGATPFQRPEWLIPWWRHLGGGDLLVLALRERQRLVALAPLFRWTRPGGERQLSPLGAGHSDYLDLLAAPEAGPTAVTQLLAWLVTQKAEWDLLDLPDLPRTSPVLRAPLPTGLSVRQLAPTGCAVVDLPTTKERYLAGLSRSHRQNLRRAARLLAGRGPVDAYCADEAALPAALDDLFRLHGARWSERDEPGMLARPAVRAFHREAAAGLQRRGALRLHVLRCAGRTVAVLHALVDARRAYYYLSGFDPEFARESPGALVVWRAIDGAIDEGLAEFDLLRGDERYKERWGAVWRPNPQLVAWHRPVPEQVVEAVEARTPV